MTHRFVEGESNRTLLMLHGTGGDESDLLGLGRALDPSAALLSPRGRVLEHGMPRFFRRVAAGVFDIDDLHARTRELADFAASAAAEYGFDPSGLIAVGYSNGANIAASLLLSRPEALAGAALLHAMPPFDPPDPPDLTGKPILITAGRIDSMVPPDQAERLADTYRRSGAQVCLEWMPGGHELTQDEVDTVRDWLATFPGS